MDNYHFCEKLAARIYALLRCLNWLRIKSVNISVHRNRSRVGRGAETGVRAGNETVVIELCGGPGFVDARADNFRGPYDLRMVEQNDAQ